MPRDNRKKKPKGKHDKGKNSERLGRPRFKRKRRPCRFCVEKGSVLDYQKVEEVRRFLTDRGKIAPRRLSGCCAKHQRMVAMAIKRARQMGLVPYAID